jgi:hypothetical protein
VLCEAPVLSEGSEPFAEVHSKFSEGRRRGS